MKKTPPRIWDAPAILLLLGIVLFSAWRLQTAGWMEGTGYICNASIVGCGLGLALGYSQYQKRGIYLLVAAYTLVILAGQLLGAIKFESDIELWDRLRILFGRLFTDLRLLSGGKAVKDQFFVVALLCIPYWFASLFSGFHLTRRANFLRAVLPNGILMFIVQAYHYTSKDYTWMFGAYLFLALLLLSRLKYLEDRKKWAGARVQISSESGSDIANAAFAAAAALILLAWAAPYTLPATAAGRQFWQGSYGKLFSGDRFENVFASIDAESQPKPRNFLTELSLGARTPQSDQVIFRVFTPESASKLPRLYWRGQIYDKYESGRWQTTGKLESRRTAAEGDIEIPDGRHSIRFGFTFDVLVEGQSTLYAPSQPIWVNRDAIMLYSEATDTPSKKEFTLDVMALRASPPLEAGDLYRASALIGNPTIGELREAGQDYPAWVLLKYLQLPKDFSPRIRELAASVAAPYDNPFDKARAITEYLRAEIEYSSSVSPPNGTVDPLEYVLFESKKGFCNYYASAEVLMLRSVGIPARLAVGYAQGEPNLQNSIYVVRERDLHAWPEAYFPEYGWVEFEPTVNQEPLERPERRDETAALPFTNPGAPSASLEEEEAPKPNLEEEAPTPIFVWQSALLPALTWLGIAALLLLGIVLKKRFAPQSTAASILKRAVERAGWTPPRWLQEWLAFINRPVIERHFHSVNLSLRWMKRPQPAHVTAGERAWILKHILPTAADSIETLLNEHEAELFTSRGGNAVLTRKAAWNILYRTLQRRLKILILGYNYAETQDTPRYSP